ncbi:hypothetical protein BO94DRAFT_576386 [Aspergillus sclerotioniger CBS 115572]|uniref:Uncharacterized protein n=1 Tax=Aspergillus sclerotioniger CBS 115572 TaxID=1450535 RepID=A0A317WCU3_9EURO|nr:hypothetical protein BO94DRAFT_576386 [Aspergillus sclerotioniger CBS 115572]PWY83177.1 hypothetical protein BO94DRAFT_576386 [Aspergillus sclerotioniger CBS 115572]
MGDNQVRDASPQGPSPKPIHEEPQPASRSETQEQTDDVGALKTDIVRLKAALHGERREGSKQGWSKFPGESSWPAPDPTYPPMGFRDLFFAAKSWAECYVEEDTAVLAKSSTNEKQSILRALEGYCVQDLDWDTFIGSLPYPICDTAPRKLAQSMLVKDVIDKFFINPFYYLDEMTYHEEKQTEKSPSFPQHLQHLFQQFLTASPASAMNWKTETVRLANSAEDNQAPNTELGMRTKKRREEAARSFASSMLTYPPFLILLRECEDPKRKADLVGYYQKAQELAICLDQWGETCECTDLKRLSPSVFSHRSENMKAHYNHHIMPADKDDRLDGHQILFITQPVVSRLRGAASISIEERWAIIEAVVEDGKMIKEEYEKMSEEQTTRNHERGRRIAEENSRQQAEWAKLEARDDDEGEEETEKGVSTKKRGNKENEEDQKKEQDDKDDDNEGKRPKRVTKEVKVKETKRRGRPVRKGKRVANRETS